MRATAGLLLIAFLATQAWGQEEARKDQVRAAQANAIASLRDEISRLTLARNLTVKDFLDRTSSWDELTQTLQRSEQVGGPRWIGPGACQVQLAIAGPRLARALVDIAAANPKTTPLPPEVLRRYLSTWEDRTFSATGSSSGAAEVVHFRPPADAWASVNDEARRQAVNAALGDAAQQSLQSISAVPLNGQQSVGDALRQDDVGKRMRDFWMSRPVTRVDYREDLTVEVALSAPPAEVADALKSALGDKAQEADWARIRKELAGRMVAAVGRGRVEVQPQAVRPAAPLLLPDGAPQWVERQVSAEGTAKVSGSRLRAARSAEQKAIEQLEAQVQALPLTAKQTVGEAAKVDANLRQRLSLVLALARTDRVDYAEDGTVSVRVSMELRDVWEALFAAGR